MFTKNKKKILIIGGGGYVGTLLTEYLLNKDYKVTVFDTFWFGNYLKKNKNLKVVKNDIRNFDKNLLNKIHTVIHLANIANDPSADLNPILSVDINILATKKIFNWSIEKKVKKFIFASSGSVYGLKKEKKVTEDLIRIPISTYNKTKMIAEDLINFKSKTKFYAIRPATICGVSPRMRLDLSVNMLTFQALENSVITVFGGKQVRPNLHIKDMIRIYEHFLTKNLKPGFYNAGFENLSILEIAKKIKSKINTKIKILPSNDPRSYRIDSSKLIKTDFKQAYKVDDAIEELISEYKNKQLKNQKNFFTVQWMKSKKIS